MAFDLDEYVRKQNLWKGVNVYVWMKSDGVPLAPPDTNKDAALALKDQMRAKCDEDDETIRLACFRLDEEETVTTLYPPPDPEEMKEMKRCRGGHAIGFNPTNLDDFISEMKQYLGMVYKYADDVEYVCAGVCPVDTAYVEHNNVRVSLQQLSDEVAEIEGTYNHYKRKWKVWLTTKSGIRNETTNIKPVGTYWTVHRAIEAAMNAFLQQQVHEAILYCI